MKYISKGLGAAALLTLSVTQANAEIINFTLTGTVNNTSENTWYYGANVFGLSIGDTITATAEFDDSLLSSNFPIDFGSPDIAMTITVGNTVFNDSDDLSGGAWLYFVDAEDDFFDGINFDYNDISYRFSGLSFSSNIWDKDFDSSNFCCDFDGDDFDGTWTSASVSAVPVPAAAWLFGSGLLGLTGMARRKAA